LKTTVSFTINSLALEKNIQLNLQQQLVNKIASAMELKESTLGIFIDLSKAFDTINHEILLAKLHHCGIRGTVHNWFKSYLSNRKQYRKDSF